MTHRHVTNVRVPFEMVDINLMVALEDYRLGDPVPGKGETAFTLAELKHRNIMGLYATDEAIRRPEVVKLTGWKNPAMGVRWVP